METRKLQANGIPICPKTNYEEDEAAERIRQLQDAVEQISYKIVNQLLQKADIAEWAKQDAKPSYTAAEVGADAEGSAAGALEEAKGYADDVLADAMTYSDNALADAKTYSDRSLETAKAYSNGILADAREYADSTYMQAAGYTDAEIAKLIGAAPSTLNTLEEIADAMAENETVVEALNAAMGTKASEAEFQFHISNNTIHATATEKKNWNAARAKIDGINEAYGTCPTAAATAAKEVMLAENTAWELKPGSRVTVKFDQTNTAQTPTLNVNGTGARSIVYNTSVITTGSLSYAGYAGRYIQYIYDGERYVFAGWSVDNNTTYTPASLGGGYGTCPTAAATAAKTAALSGYSLVTGGTVAVRFTYDVPASATLNINGKGAKPIYYRGAAITAGVIRAGDIATFIYSTQYHVIAIDNVCTRLDGIDTEIEGMKANFRDGCNTIAAKITACGEATDDNASPQTMAANIQKIYTDRYNAGVAAADARVNTQSESYKGGYNAGVKAAKVGTAAAADVRTGRTFTNASGSGIAGTMADRGAVSQALNCGGSYTIPDGYHNGSGRVTANSLAGQTQADAAAANLTKGKTAWVNGKKITGTGADNTAHYNNGYSAALAKRAFSFRWVCKIQNNNVNDTAQYLNDLLVSGFSSMTVTVNENSAARPIYIRSGSTVLKTVASGSAVIDISSYDSLNLYFMARYNEEARMDITISLS